jgi:hypothetical protein
MVVGAPPTGAGLKSAGQPSVFDIDNIMLSGHIDTDNGPVLWPLKRAATSRALRSARKRSWFLCSAR